MSVHVLLFGSIADRLKTRECFLPVRENMTVAWVINEVGCETLKPVLVAVNQEQIHDMDYILNDGDEVALMPPFSGG